MANGTMATPNLLTDPGFLYWAPLGSTAPTNTVAGSVFTDTWPVAWIPLGMTDAGSTFTPSLTVEAVEAAESFDPIQYRTTGRTASVAFQLLDFTATNLARTFNGGAPTTVSGTGATALTSFAPPTPGQEVRCMIGYESLDSTVRFIAYQVINSGDVAMSFVKAPGRTGLSWNANLEKPASTQPWQFWTAGTARA